MTIDHAATATTRTPDAATTRRGLRAFLALAFGLAWAPFLPALFGGPVLPLVLMGLAPALACVVVRRWVTREGFGDAGLRLDVRRHWPHLLVAGGWPFVTAPLSVVVAVVLGLAPEGITVAGALGSVEPLTLLAYAGASLLITPLILGEELGWRGYLQLRLFPRHPLRAAVATGLLWGVWHYPWLFAMSGWSADAVVMVAMFTTATTYGSVFLGWLRERTGSVWSAGLGHGANNTTEDSLTRSLFSGGEGTTLGVAASFAVLLAEAGVLLTTFVVASRRRSRTG